jgi:hypothetical protein
MWCPQCKHEVGKRTQRRKNCNTTPLLSSKDPRLGATRGYSGALQWITVDASGHLNVYLNCSGAVVVAINDICWFHSSIANGDWCVFSFIPPILPSALPNEMSICSTYFTFMVCRDVNQVLFWSRFILICSLVWWQWVRSSCAMRSYLNTWRRTRARSIGGSARRSGMAIGVVF